MEPLLAEVDSIMQLLLHANRKGDPRAFVFWGEEFQRLFGQMIELRKRKGFLRNQRKMKLMAKLMGEKPIDYGKIEKLWTAITKRYPKSIFDAACDAHFDHPSLFSSDPRGSEPISEGAEDESDVVDGVVFIHRRLRCYDRKDVSVDDQGQGSVGGSEGGDGWLDDYGAVVD